MDTITYRNHASGTGAGFLPSAGSKTMSPVMSEDRVGAPTLKCFVVEDNAVIRQNLIATLEELLGVEIVGTADSEGAALDWLKRDDSHACDLMIIDIFLKSGTGLEVLRQARSLRPRAVLVVLTNYATADMRRRCTQLGADRVFDKSAELEELLAYCEELASTAGQ
jgi:DNA-binding NarL/FixJ family response regulator